MIYLVYRVPEPRVGVHPECIGAVEAAEPGDACMIAASLTQLLGNYIAVEAHLTSLGVQKPTISNQGILTFSTHPHEGLGAAEDLD